MGEEKTAGSRRERYRAATRQEAKAIALRQLADGGASALSLNAIGREMGLTGPALYRYFDSRDALLTQLIVDAYADLGDAVAAAAVDAATLSPADRLRALAAAYRGWALAQPHRYLLLFGTPVPGYDAPSETVALARRIIAPFLAALAELPAPSTDAPREQLDRQLGRWAEETDQTVSGDVLRRGVVCWTRTHGMLSLELAGHFNLMGFDPALLYDAEVEALLAPYCR